MKNFKDIFEAHRVIAKTNKYKSVETIEEASPGTMGIRAAKADDAERRKGIEGLSDARLKYHVVKNFPHGSFNMKDLKDEHLRRRKSVPNYHAIKPSLNEETIEEAETLTELSDDLLKRYLSKQSAEIQAKWGKEPISMKRVKAGFKASQIIADRKPIYPKVIDLSKMSDDGDVYDETQTNEKITDGDVLKLKDNRYAILIQAWPTMIIGDSKILHTATKGPESIATISRGRYKKSVELAKKTAGTIKEQIQYQQKGYTLSSARPLNKYELAKHQAKWDAENKKKVNEGVLSNTVKVKRDPWTPDVKIPEKFYKNGKLVKDKAYYAWVSAQMSTRTEEVEELDENYSIKKTGLKPTIAHPDGKPIHDIIHKGEVIGTISPSSSYKDTKKPGARIVSSRKNVTKYSFMFHKDKGPQSHTMGVYTTTGHASPNAALEWAAREHARWAEKNVKEEVLDEARSFTLGKNDKVIGSFKASKGAKLVARKKGKWHDIYVHNTHDNTGHVIQTGVNGSHIEKALSADHHQAKFKRAGGVEYHHDVLKSLHEETLDEAFKAGDKVTYQKNKNERGTAVVSSASAAKKNHFYIKTNLGSTLLVPQSELVREEVEQLDEISDATKRSWLDKAVGKSYDEWNALAKDADPAWKAKWMTPTGKIKKAYWDSPEYKKIEAKRNIRRDTIQKTSKAVTGKPHFSTRWNGEGEEGNAMDWHKGKKYAKEDVNELFDDFLDEELKYSNESVSSELFELIAHAQELYDLLDDENDMDVEVSIGNIVRACNQDLKYYLSSLEQEGDESDNYDSE